MNGFYLAKKFRQNFLDGIPYNSQIYCKIAMNQPIAHAGDFSPGNMLVLLLQIWPKFRHSFANDFEVSNHCILNQAIRKEVFLGFAFKIALNPADCLFYMTQVILFT